MIGKEEERQDFQEVASFGAGTWFFASLSRLVSSFFSALPLFLNQEKIYLTNSMSQPNSGFASSTVVVSVQ